jgi:hypothetical protein
MNSARKKWQEQKIIGILQGMCNENPIIFYIYIFALKKSIQKNQFQVESEYVTIDKEATCAVQMIGVSDEEDIRCADVVFPE